MKNKVTRLLALMLSMVMVTLLAACGSESKEESKVTENSKQNEQTEQSGEDTASDEEEELETITLTFGTHSAYWGAGDGVFTDNEPVLQWIREQIGVEIEFVTFDNEKYSVLLAGGDIPDICCGWSSLGMPEMISSGQILEISSLLEEYGQDIMNKMPIGMAAVKSRLGNNEGYYAIPGNAAVAGEIPMSNGNEAFRIRYDVWKAIGSPEYETMDELIEVLKQMQDYIREQTGDDTYYGVTAYLADGTWNFSTGIASMGYLWGGIEAPLNLTTAEFEADVSDPDAAWWTVVEFFNKAYRAGILDPESLTQDMGTFSGKMKGGKCLSAFSNSVNMSDGLKEDVFYACLPYGPFTSIRGIYGTNAPTGSGDLYYFINSECEYPERAMQLLNLLWSDEGCRAIYNGVPGVHWDYDENGVPVYIGELAAAYDSSKSEGDTLRNDVSMSDRNPVWWSGGNMLASLDGQAISIHTSEAFLEKYSEGAELKFAQDYGCTYPAQVYAKWVEEGRLTTDKNSGKALTCYGLMRTNTDEELEWFQKGNNYFVANVASVVLAETAEEYETAKTNMIENIKNLGFEKWTAAWDEMYEQAKADYEAMMAE